MAQQQATTDLRSVYEKELEARHTRICESYTALSAEHPTASRHKILSYIADKVKMTVPGVKNILIDNGLYQIKKRS